MDIRLKDRDLDKICDNVAQVIHKCETSEKLSDEAIALIQKTIHQLGGGLHFHLMAISLTHETQTLRLDETQSQS